MIKYYRYLILTFALVVLLAGILVHVFGNRREPIMQYTSIDRQANINPDYHGSVIPPNIAPLNFNVQEDGSNYYVKIYSKKGEPTEVFSRSPKIVIPEGPWHKLVNKNRGEKLHFDVFVKTEHGKWKRFGSITNQIAHEEIDDYLVYRKIYPTHGKWRDMGIYQRNLRNYDESLLLDNDYYKGGCLNCHTFCRNRPNKMLIGIRSSDYGSSALFVEDGVVNKIGTKFGYTSWHPSGRLAVYSINKVRQFFHTAQNEVRGVIDLDSLLAYYLVDSKRIKTSPVLSRKERLETYPTWSADGQSLYFCSAEKPWLNEKEFSFELYTKVKYDLVRIHYDLESDTWGQANTILSSQETGLSILMPRISPDGNWLLFCMCNYGCFPVYHRSSDLYLMDLRAAKRSGQYSYRRLAINSDQSETWHSWSSNNRWIAFSSKRKHGIFTRIYFSYVDQNGKVYKPLLLPQKNPLFYSYCLKTYSVPELIVKPVQITKEKLGRAIRSSRQITVDMPITMATPKAGALPRHEEPWHGGRE